MTTTGPDIESLIAAFDERHTQMSGDYGVFCRLDDARWPCPDRMLIDALAPVYEAAEAMVALHDGDEHSDATWPCDGACKQARELRSALERNPR